MGNFIDLTGQKFGRLTVIERAYRNKFYNWYWNCKCDCGKETTVMGSHLRRGLIKSCGCIKEEKWIKDLTGLTLGRLLVIERISHSSKRKYYLCECSCGKLVEVSATALATGATVSCGCYNTDIITTHGKSKTKLYGNYNKMKRRCANINDRQYADYGGRGIYVCKEWVDDFMCFYNWSFSNGFKEGANLTIDRIDNNGPYSPDNCRWVLQKEQARNKRNNHNLTLHGKTQCLAAWCEELDMCSSTIVNRLNLGWSEEKALTHPLKPNGKRKKRNN